MNRDTERYESRDEDDWLDLGLIVAAVLSVVAFGLLVAMEKLP